MKVLEVLWDLFDLAISGLAGVTRRIAFMEKLTPEPPPSAGITEAMWSRVQAGKTYVKALTRILVVCALFPLPVLVAGIFADLGWLVAIVGIFWALWSFLLLVLAAPIGVLLEFILGGIKGIADRYVKFSLGVFLVELLFTLFVSVVPIQNNPSAIPIVIVASAALGIIAARGVQTPFTQQLISLVVTLIFIIFTLSFFFPKTFASVRNWSRELDARVSDRVEGVEPPTESSPAATASPRDTVSENASRRVADSTLAQRLSEIPAAIAVPNAIRVKRIEGVAYSYSKDAWAEVHPGFSAFEYGGDGTYPRADLVFTSGLVVSYGRLNWKGSHQVFADHIKVGVNDLQVSDSYSLPEFYRDFGIGYGVLLENAIFLDYRMSKSLMVFRTFAGDTPPKLIEKEFEVRKIELSDEQLYSIGGEWYGSLDLPQERGTRTARQFTARFVQHGNRFDGVVIDSYSEDRGYEKRNKKARARVSGFIIDDKVTFVKTYQGQAVGDSYVAPFAKGVPTLEGKCYSGLYIGAWKMTWRGNFEGSPDDIVGVDMSHH